MKSGKTSLHWGITGPLTVPLVLLVWHPHPREGYHLGGKKWVGFDPQEEFQKSLSWSGTCGANTSWLAWTSTGNNQGSADRITGFSCFFSGNGRRSWTREERNTLTCACAQVRWAGIIWMQWGLNWDVQSILWARRIGNTTLKKKSLRLNGWIFPYSFWLLSFSPQRCWGWNSCRSQQGAAILACLQICQGQGSKTRLQTLGWALS